MRVPSLIVLALIAGGLAWALHSTQKRAAQEDVPTEALLGGRRLFDAKTIVLQRAADSPALHFTRNDPYEPFRLVEPIQDLASAAFLENVRGVLDTAQRFLDGPVAEIGASRLQQMGLDAPRGRIEARYPDKTIALDIGLEGPLHQDVYVRMDGSVFRTGLAVWSAIQVNPDDARERLLVQTHPDDIRRLALRRRQKPEVAGQPAPEEVVEIERTGTETFALLQPLRTSADTSAAANLFAFLCGMVAEQFLSSLNPMPEWDVQIEIEGGRGTERITVWKTEQGLIGRQEPRNVEFTIKAIDYTRTFNVAVDDLRARLLVPTAMADIGRVELDPGQGNGERIQLRRAASDAMVMFQPFECETEPAPVNDLLQASQNLRIVAFVPAAEVAGKGLGAYGLDRGFLTVSVHPRRAENQPAVLLLGRDDGEHTFVKRTDEDYVAKVPKPVVDVLRRPWPTYATRSAAIPVPTDTAEIRYSIGGVLQASLRRDQGGVWRRVDAQGNDGTANLGDQALELIEIAGSLRGKRTFDAQESEVASALAAARPVRIEFVAPASGASKALVVHDRGSDSSGARQAWVMRASAPRVVVELGPADTRALLAPLSP